MNRKIKNKQINKELSSNESIKTLSKSDNKTNLENWFYTFLSGALVASMITISVAYGNYLLQELIVLSLIIICFSLISTIDKSNNKNL